LSYRRELVITAPYQEVGRVDIFFAEEVYATLHELGDAVTVGCGIEESGVDVGHLGGSLNRGQRQAGDVNSPQLSGKFIIPSFVKKLWVPA
jgi:hypothetical protein